MIDWVRVNTLRDDVGADGFPEIVRIFLEEMTDLRDALQDPSHPHSLEHTLHALKNGALTLGFDQLSDLCQVGETQSARGQAEQVDRTEILRVLDHSLDLFQRGLSDPPRGQRPIT